MEISCIFSMSLLPNAVAGIAGFLVRRQPKKTLKNGGLAPGRKKNVQWPLLSKA
jgi:hypothetical protein